MKKVTLYQVSKTTQVVSGDYLELRSYSYDQITPIRNSEEFIIQKDKCVEVTNLPIQKFAFHQKDWKTGEVETNVVYASFDEELLKLIQCERDRFKGLQEDLITLSGKVGGLEADNVYLQDQASQLKVKVCRIEQMGFWKRLVFLFKGKVE